MEIQWHAPTQQPAQQYDWLRPYGYLRITFSQFALISTVPILQLPTQTTPPCQLPDWLSVLLAHHGKTTILPLQQQGSPFAQQIWQQLATLAPGQFCSYQDLAIAIGKPGATQAVGRAVGQNPLAEFIPCHRVIRKDGGLGGYHWGADHKLALLSAEGLKPKANGKW